jgi:hypothetical protein
MEVAYAPVLVTSSEYVPAVGVPVSETEATGKSEDELEDELVTAALKALAPVMADSTALIADCTLVKSVFRVCSADCCDCREVNWVCICCRGSEANETARWMTCARSDENWLLPVKSALVLLVLLI